MKKLLIFAALSEGATGLILLAYPPIVVRLLFDEEIAGSGVFMSRLAGASLVALAVACWPDGDWLRGFYGMVTFSSLAMLYLGVLGVGGNAGILLWPAVVVHAALVAFLVLGWWRQRKIREAAA